MLGRATRFPDPLVRRLPDVYGAFRLRVDYRLSARQNVFLDVRSTRLGDGIADSPLVDRSTQTGLRVGYLYRF